MFSEADDLIARLRAGDATAFRVVSERYFEKLARFAYHFVGSVDLAQDVAQAVLVRVWHRRDALRMGHSLDAYLYTAARNESLNVMRRRQIEVELDGTSPHPTVPSVAETYEADEASAALARAVSALTPRQTAAIHLRYEAGLTYPAIAEVLGVTVNAVERLVQRGVRDLRARLADE